MFLVSDIQEKIAWRIFNLNLEGWVIFHVVAGRPPNKPNSKAKHTI